jgi:hypothetical protein
MQSWASITGTLIRPEEYQVLMEMDAAFINELHAEISAQWARERQEQEKRNG